MKFKENQHVTYDGRRWIVTGHGNDGKGRTVYFLKRGCYQTTAYEEEVTI